MKTQTESKFVSHVACIIRSMLVVIAVCCSNPVNAQVKESADSIRINPEFLKALDQTFSFEPVEAPVRDSRGVLTREQLHEWVGPIEVTKPLSVSIPGLGAFSDGLQHYGKRCHSLKEGGFGYTLDVNALAKYILPSEIVLRKMRTLAEKSKGIMDMCLPMDGLPMAFRTDTSTLDRSTEEK